MVQLFIQSPRGWRPSQHGLEALARYRSLAARRHLVTFCHAPYLINLATPDPAVRERSRTCLAANLQGATDAGAQGLVVHVGSHRGAALGCVPRVAEAVASAAAAVRHPCRLLLENAAGAGGTVGRTLEELAAIVEQVGTEAPVGVCLDTQHLWAAGVDFASAAGTEALVGALDATVGREALGCMHVNDSRVALGANRDRHANLGEGTIGLDGLAWLLGHPALAGVPGILEVAGEGDGPRRSDLELARELVETGRRRWEGSGGVEPPSAELRPGGGGSHACRGEHRERRSA